MIIDDDDDVRLPGPPLTNDTAVGVLLAHGVEVGLGVREGNGARNVRFDVAWVSVVVFDDAVR